MTSNYLPSGPPPSQRYPINQINSNNALPISNSSQFPPPHLYPHNSTGSNYATGSSSITSTSNRREDSNKLIRSTSTQATAGRRTSDSRFIPSNIPAVYDESYDTRRGSTVSLPSTMNSFHQSTQEPQWNQSWDQENERRLLNTEPLDIIHEALRASEQDAENYRIRMESESAEEARIYQATLSYSYEQANLREARILEEEEAEEIAMREALARSKGKARETELDRLEREEQEEMEIVLALSLSETKVPVGETSSEVFERLSRPSNPSESSFPSPAPGRQLASTSTFTILSAPNDLQRISSSFYVANPDLEEDEVPPPAYTIESQLHQDVGQHTSSSTIVESLSSDPSNLFRISGTELTTSEHSNIHHDSSFYSSNITAINNEANHASSSLTTSITSELSTMQLNEDAQDPFDENFAAVEMNAEDYYSDEDDADTIEFSTTSVYDNQSINSHLLQLSPTASTSQLSPSPSQTASRGNSPLFGGLVESSSLNADPDDIVLQGIKFGFLPFSRASKHPPIELEGCFPDIAQLSRGNEDEFICFAIESYSWEGLLTYLMWYGNSMIEAAPSDLQSTKSTLSCRITLEFYRSFLDAKERVRVRIDLLTPKTSQLSEIPPASFDSHCPNITIRLPQTQTLPFSLATLATSISTAHTLSRQNNKSAWSNNLVSATNSNQHRVLKDLSLAIDLFRKLRGDNVEDEIVEDEDGLLIKLKGRLKRRKKIELLAAEGQLVPGGALPETAMMVTPFRLID